MLLLDFLTGGGAVVLVKASDNALNCGYAISCHATLKLMTDVTEIKNQLDEPSGKQATDFEELNVNLTRNLDPTVMISDVSEKLDKLAAHVRDICNKQVKDEEELNFNRSLASTAAISTLLEKHSADLLKHKDRLNPLTANVAKTQRAVRKL